MISEPLHLYAIPQEVLSSLVLRPSPLAPRLPEPPSRDVDTSNSTAVTSNLNAATCTLCVGASFGDVQDQRSHFRSDWHRYNVKLRLQNTSAPAVTEAEFGSLVDGLEDSLSGSESTASDGSADSTDAVSALLRTRLKNRSRSASPEARNIPKSPILWFTSTQIPDTQFGVYATVFPTDTAQASYVDELRSMQDGGETGRQWAVFMTAGGHFAGAVIRVSWPSEDEESSTGKKKKSQKGVFEVIQHKTFHRYTTRRKQGGSQSVNDNAKGPAKSAGAQLRRYGEQALKDDIRGLLVEWQGDIDLSERIFIRASTANKKIFLDFDESPIKKGDQRLRTFPFPTRRPTQAEVIRCVTELTRVKISHLTEEALAAQDQAVLDSLPKPKPVPTQAPKQPAPKKPEVQKLTKEEEYQRDLWQRLLDMVRKGRLDALKAFWEKQGQSLVGSVDGILPEWLEGKDSGAGGTLLQLAAASGQAEVTRWLLEDLRADPTIPAPPSFTRYREAEEAATSDADTSKPSRGLQPTAYDLASSPESRNVFRRCAYAHPDWWDWLGKARLKSVLSPEMEEKQQREENKRKKMREKAKEREAALAAQAEPVAPAPTPQPPPKKAPEPKSGPQKVGGSRSAEKDRQAVAGLTPEMRAQIERERRARAAEARMRGLGQ